MGKKDKLRKQMAKRGLTDERVLVICTGKKCGPRTDSKALVAVAEEMLVSQPRIRLATVGCLHVCKRGPIAATFPKIRIKKRVDEARLHRMVARLAR